MTRPLLDEIRAKARLPVLPNIRVASPCTADWSAMAPVDADAERVRHCGSCNKNVYNLSQMTRAEAEALIVAHEGRLCVRYYQRKDGTILLRDCAVGVANGRKRRVIAAGAAALLAGVSAAVSWPKLSAELRGHSDDMAATIAPETREDIQAKVAGADHDDPAPPAPIVVDEPVPVEIEVAPMMGGIKPAHHDPKKGDPEFDYELIQGGL